MAMQLGKPLLSSRLVGALLAGWLMLPSAADAQPSPAARRDTILATGSSTVAPFTRAVGAVVAEGAVRTVDVRAVGTLGGYAEFCQGMSLRHPDIQDASRRITMAEFTHCASRGVHEIMEIPIGYDGIVLAHRAGLASPNMRLTDIWRGLAREVPIDGRLVPNPYMSWRQVSPRLPDWPIKVLVPPTTSGTRESFIELAMLPGCQAVPEVQAVTERSSTATC